MSAEDARAAIDRASDAFTELYADRQALATIAVAEAVLAVAEAIKELEWTASASTGAMP